MYALAEVDVTKARTILASLDPPSSLTAFVIASVARAAAAHPEVHAYRNWRGQLVTLSLPIISSVQLRRHDRTR